MHNKGVQGTLHKVSGPLTPDVGRKKNMKPILALVIVFAVSLTALADDVESNAYLDVNRAINTARGYVQDGAISYFNAPLAWTNLALKTLTYDFDSSFSPITLTATIKSSVQSNAVSTNVTDITSDEVEIHMDNFGVMVGNAISLGHTGRMISGPSSDDIIPPQVIIEKEPECVQQGGPGYPPQGVGSPDP